LRKILGAAIGSCVHVAGIMSFLNIARSLGFETKFSYHLKRECDRFRMLSKEEVRKFFKD
jgi:hypothetical protein